MRRKVVVRRRLVVMRGIMMVGRLMVMRRVMMVGRVMNRNRIMSRRGVVSRRLIVVVGHCVVDERLGHRVELGVSNVISHVSMLLGGHEITYALWNVLRHHAKDNCHHRSGRSAQTMNTALHSVSPIVCAP